MIKVKPSHPNPALARLAGPSLAEPNKQKQTPMHPIGRAAVGGARSEIKEAAAESTSAAGRVEIAKMRVPGGTACRNPYT